MRSLFPGFPQAGIEFLRALARHNRREWFLPRKAVFEEQVKRPMTELVEALNAALARIAPEHVTPPGKAIYRFYRDTRFTDDKRPYKEQIAATFPLRGLARHAGAAYYFSVSHKEVAIGGGVYLPPPESLAAIRSHIAGRAAEFRRLSGSPALRKLYGAMQGEQLARTPKGYPPDHPAADLLRFKQFLFYDELAPDIATTPALYTEIWRRFQAMAPFLAFLNEPLAAARNRGPSPWLPIPSA
jgi:uncharacterized protein (TIGR02453 family)